jgi:hypothetical protein
LPLDRRDICAAGAAKGAVHQDREMSAEHIVRIGCVEPRAVHLLTWNQPKASFDALRDELLVQAWG